MKIQNILLSALLLACGQAAAYRITIDNGTDFDVQLIVDRTGWCALTPHGQYWDLGTIKAKSTNNVFDAGDACCIDSIELRGMSGAVKGTSTRSSAQKSSAFQCSDVRLRIEVLPIQSSATPGTIQLILRRLD